jgi:hypothetical protein
LSTLSICFSDSLGGFLLSSIAIGSILNRIFGELPQPIALNGLRVTALPSGTCLFRPQAYSAVMACLRTAMGI